MELGPTNRVAMLIGDERCFSSDGAMIDALDPATEEVIGHVPDATPHDVDRAVEAAISAQRDWAIQSYEERAALLRKLVVRISADADLIRRIEVRDTGNTWSAMALDVEKSIAQLEYYLAAGVEAKGAVPSAPPGRLSFTQLEPFGVVGRIVPFNHPFMFMAGRAGAPLIMGNTLVIKAPETSSLSAHLFADACQETLPPGVVNIVTGHGRGAGDALVRHPAVKRIAFTGSTATGLAIQRAAAETGVKHLSLELGGKNPMLVFPDCDFDAAVAAAVKAMNFGWQGQSCGSTSRVFVHESMYGSFVDAVGARMAALRIAHPMDPQSQAGPVNSLQHYNHVMRLIGLGSSEGARIVCGGGRPAGEEFERGYWIAPTLFADVEPVMSIARDEVFGPVLSVLRWSDEAELLALANSLAYGLTASVWTRDLDRGLRFARAVRAGYVWVNGGGAHHLGLPFGGYGNSGIGREESIEELASFAEAKAISVYLN